MRNGIVVDVTAADRAGDGLTTNAIMRKTGRTKSVVWLLAERVMQEGVDRLLRDKTRPPGRSAAMIEQVVALTAQASTGETTHWTARMRPRGRHQCLFGPAELAGPADLAGPQMP
jgi:hypothetical protein